MAGVDLWRTGYPRGLIMAVLVLCLVWGWTNTKQNTNTVGGALSLRLRCCDFATDTFYLYESDSNGWYRCAERRIRAGTNTTAGVVVLFVTHNKPLGIFDALSLTDKRSSSHVGWLLLPTHCICTSQMPMAGIDSHYSVRRRMYP